MPTSPSTLKVALDWTPNTNHTPFYVAQSQSLYPNLSVSFLSPSTDNYTTSPAKRIITGEADIALCPSESILAYQEEGRGQLVAVAALLGRDASGIVALAEKGVKTPADFEGKTYASYNAKYEDGLVKQLLINAGSSSGEFKVDTPARLDVWPNLLEGKIDFAWVFLPWEGLQAKRRGINLVEFQLGDYGLEYGYSPVLAVSKEWLKSSENQEKLKEFLAGTAKAVDWIISHPVEAADVLLAANPGVKDLEDAEFVRESQKLVNEYYKREGSKWGVGEEGVWKAFLGTLGMVDEGLKGGEVDVKGLYTNEYLA